MGHAQKGSPMPATIGTRLLCHKTGGEEWLLVKDRVGQVAVERRAAPSGKSERFSLEAFIQSGKPRTAQQEFRRLIGTLIEEAEAGSETS